MRAWVDGELRQDGRTSDLIFPVAELIEYVSGIFTLLPGDVILTGTPAGVGPIDVGQRVEVEVEGIGRFGNPVVRRGSAGGPLIRVRQPCGPRPARACPATRRG